jgi:hypothetical protein
MTATAVARVTGYSAYWIGQIARRYNRDGPDSVQDRRHTVCAGQPNLSSAQLAELRHALASSHPDGDRWCGRTVARWIAERLGRPVGRQLGWRYRRRLGARWLHPRPRPLAPVQYRFVWRYLVGFVHPASGRTVFHLASTVSIPLFEEELTAFARAIGAGPTKQIVLVLDRAGWHSSVRLRVPDHVHLLFLPPYSP